MDELKSRIEYTYELRPLKENNNILRYANGNWIKDDGEWDIAFADMAEQTTYGIDMPFYIEVYWSWCELMLWGRFLPEHPRGNAWHYVYTNKKTCTHWDKRYNHPNVRAQNEAMNIISQKKGCSHGESAEFHINDPYIVAGKVRVKETQEIIKFPEIFDCVYCGEINWREREKELRAKLGLKDSPDKRR